MLVTVKVLRKKLKNLKISAKTTFFRAKSISGCRENLKPAHLLRIDVSMKMKISAQIGMRIV